MMQADNSCHFAIWACESPKCLNLSLKMSEITSTYPLVPSPMFCQIDIPDRGEEKEKGKGWWSTESQ